MYYFYGTALLFAGLTGINFIFSYQSKNIDPQFWVTLKFQVMMLPLFLITNLCIGYGIKFGFKAVQNLGFVLIAAKCMEVLISLGMGYLFLKELPNWKTWVGLGIIAVGLVFVKQK
ncbi:hypothetical protein [Cohnella herbarum]|uniref:EamA domain-containing protein n=1 Tax=Cohnella herbarum TaxID=2728023 RepID=A0A7Z2VHA4_9BACL|nr:hypothetical protein [Cohnella herbarum]QJD82975.1 hypothetical protein HH215_07165 [Cohnella herbarum]